eukprot:2964948-Rhodomonas_salina.1
MLRRVLQIRSQCSKNSAEAPRDTGHRHNGRLRARRTSLQIVGLAHLVRGCCEWYCQWIVLLASGEKTKRPGAQIK